MFRIQLSFVFLLVIICGNVCSQQLPQVSNFMFNQLLYNPAAAGMHETDFNANLLTRFQWGGASRGGPSSNMLWSDYRLSNNKMAVGLNLSYDKFGASSNLDVAGNYAYYVPLTNKLKLAMGLRLGVTSARLNTSGLTAWDADDPVIAATDVQTIYPKAGTGFQLLTKNFYAGIALPDLLTSDKYNLYGNKDRSFFDRRRNYMVMSGYKWKINDTYDLYPNVRLSYYTGGSLKADLNMILEITDYFWAGLTYSTSNNHSIMAGTHISSRIRFAYAYEFSTKSEPLVPLSAHEINLMLNLDDLFKK
jgi:type IX secretion system PorP/SprF family membrane protein